MYSSREAATASEPSNGAPDSMKLVQGHAMEVLLQFLQEEPVLAGTSTIGCHLEQDFRPPRVPIPYVQAYTASKLSMITVVR